MSFFRVPVLCRNSCAFLVLHTRGYARGLVRRPLNVLTSEEAKRLDKSSKTKDSRIAEHFEPSDGSGEGLPPRAAARFSPRLQAVEADRDRDRRRPESPTTCNRSSNKLTSTVGHAAEHEDRQPYFTLPDNVEYTKLSAGDQRFGPVITVAKSRKTRKSKGLILLEGQRLISDAIDAGVTVTKLYFSRVELLQGLPLERLDAQLFKVRHEALKLWSDVVTPQGIMAICKMPKMGEAPHRPECPLPITLLLDNIRDPGNMGTMLRTAAAVGCDKVLATKGCVDVWEPKVLRSAAGAHFRVNIFDNVGWEHVGNYLHPEARVVLGDCQTEHKRTTRRASSETMKKILSMQTEVFTERDEEGAGEGKLVDEAFLDEEKLKVFQDAPLPVSCYTDLEYDPEAEHVVVIGGETQGLSPAAHKLAFDRNGDKVYIPMAEGVDSLNSTIAGGVILFEVKRQLLRKQNLEKIVQEQSR